MLHSLQEEASALPDHQRYVVLLHDEVTIQQDLVFDFKTGQLVGYVCPEEQSQSTVKELYLTLILIL